MRETMLPKMVSIANNSVHQISEADQKPIELIRSQLPVGNPTPGHRRSQIANSDEPLIDAVDEPAGPDPLLIDETGDPNNQWILLECNSPKRLRSYRKRIVKDPKRLVKEPKRLAKDQKRLKTPSEFPLKRSMVYEALRSTGIAGARPWDVKNFLVKKYGVEYEPAKILQELQAGIACGDITQLKLNTKYLRNRYRLDRSYFKKSQVRCETDGNEKIESVEKAIASGIQETGIISDVKNSIESVTDDNMTRSSEEGEIKMVNSSPLGTENIVGVELDLSQLNGKPVDVLDLESRAEKVDCGPIHTDEIGFMVLHSLYCSPNPSGMRLNEIAGFIYSFYDIDAQRSLPYIKGYLDYGMNKGILFQNGDRYKKGFGTWTFNSQRYSSKPVKQINDFGDGSVVKKSNSISENFSLSNVQSEQKEIADSSSSELVSKTDGTETNINNNAIESIDVKPVAAKRMNERYDLRNIIHSKEKDVVSTSKNMGNQSLLKQLDIAKTVSPQCVKIERQYSKKTVNAIEQPFVSYTRGEVIPFSSKSTNADGEKQDGGRHAMTQLKAAFQSIKFTKHNLSDLRLKERDLPYSNKTSGKYATTPGLNLMDEHQIKFNFPVAFDEPKYTLPEIRLQMSRYPMMLLNTPAADLLWEHIAIRKNFSCLKLTGTSSSSDENLTCKFCDAKLKFGQLYCDFCFFELQNKIEKCNVCHFLCNRGDVFHKHFTWEHIPLIQEPDDDSVSVIEQNIGSLLNKLASNNLFRCKLHRCTFLTNTIDAIEFHMIGEHTTKINVFPPLPELAESDGVVIFQNEIQNTCCHRCNECGFLSNQTDYMLYHILDGHFFRDNETCEDQYFSTRIEPEKKKPLGKVKWSYGLCHVCGKFYENILHHLERHQIMRPSQLGARSTRDLDDVELHIRKELLLLTDGRLTKSRQKKKIDPNKTYLCHICGKIVTRSMYAHLRIHTYKLYDCGICGKQFNRQSNLLTHRRVHTREKPFQCDICKMMFGYKCSVKGHIINVHSETVK